MKFFSELGSCCGGAMVSPAAEVAGGGRKTTEDQGGNCITNGRETSRRAKPHGGTAVRHWKPKLNIISEDSPMLEADRGGVRQLAKKPPVKVKSRSSPVPTPSYEEEYWKSSYTMALPSFSPTSYLF